MTINRDLKALVARLEAEGTPFEAISNAPWIILETSVERGRLHGSGRAWRRCNSLEWSNHSRLIAPRPAPPQPHTPPRPTEVSRIIDLESRLQWRFPRLYRQLYTSYMFPEFDVGGVTVFANLDSSHPEDITQALFADAYMSAWLIEHGYLQFARPDTGSYDPICFDFSTAREDQKVVRLDHEDILQGRSRVRSRPVADSFVALFKAAPNAHGERA